MKTNEVNKEISYETLLVTFGEGIGRLNTMFDDPQVWGVATLKQWIDGYHIRIQHGQREGMAAKEHTDYQPGKTIKSCASTNYSSATGCWESFPVYGKPKISPLKAA